MAKPSVPASPTRNAPGACWAKAVRSARTDVLPAVAGKQPGLAGRHPSLLARDAPPFAQQLEKVGREDDIVILLALALFDPAQERGVVGETPNLVARLQALAAGYARSTLAAIELPLAASQQTAPGKFFEPTIWYHIDRDGLVTVNVFAPRWVSTSAPRLRASSPMSSRPTGATCGSMGRQDPKWGLIITGGSWSVWQSFPLYSHAGAAGRIALVEEGARLLGVPKEGCRRAIQLRTLREPFDQLCRDRPSRQLSRSYSAEELKKLPIKAP